MDTDPAKIRGGVTASCGAMGSLAYGRGCAKLARGALTALFNLNTRARGFILIFLLNDHGSSRHARRHKAKEIYQNLDLLGSHRAHRASEIYQNLDLLRSPGRSLGCHARLSYSKLRSFLIPASPMGFCTTSTEATFHNRQRSPVLAIADLSGSRGSVSLQTTHQGNHSAYCRRAKSGLQSRSETTANN
jgi:hypothetical protein